MKSKFFIVVVFLGFFVSLVFADDDLNQSMVKYQDKKLKKNDTVKYVNQFTDAPLIKGKKSKKTLSSKKPKHGVFDLKKSAKEKKKKQKLQDALLRKKLAENEVKERKAWDKVLTKGEQNRLQQIKMNDDVQQAQKQSAQTLKDSSARQIEQKKADNSFEKKMAGLQAESQQIEKDIKDQEIQQQQALLQEVAPRVEPELLNQNFYNAPPPPTPAWMLQSTTPTPVSVNQEIEVITRPPTMPAKEYGPVVLKTFKPALTIPLTRQPVFNKPVLDTSRIISKDKIKEIKNEE